MKTSLPRSAFAHSVLVSQLLFLGWAKQAHPGMFAPRPLGSEIRACFVELVDGTLGRGRHPYNIPANLRYWQDRSMWVHRLADPNPEIRADAFQQLLSFVRNSNPLQRNTMAGIIEDFLTRPDIHADARNSAKTILNLIR